MATLNGKDGVWRTVGGRHIFIANGQSLKDAMRASGKFKNLKEVETVTSDKGNLNINIDDNGRRIVTVSNDKSYLEKAKEDYLKEDKKYVDENGTEWTRAELRESWKVAKESGNTDKDFDSYVKQAVKEKAIADFESPTTKSIKALNEIDRIAGDDAFLQKKGRELGLNEFKKYMEGKPEDFIKRKDNKQSASNDNNTSKFTMVNDSGKTVTVTKSDMDGKWFDTDGNKYMSYLSKSDVKSYFKGDWKEVKDNDGSLSKQLNKTMDNKTQVAKALGLKVDESWKSTKQLYQEQKGIDLAEKAINSGKAADYLKLRDRVDSKLQEDMFNYERNFNNMNSIKNYAKVYDLDPHALYYTTNLASNADISALRKAAEVQKSIGMSQSQLKQMYIKQGYSDETAAKMAKEDISERE